ncbi:hypothetical protein BDQ17DRAFT_819022 [Cyathus striatus]|nr:hypothetical protein BDQ17DRAFT_819022 [Cyathus striatus]
MDGFRVWCRTRTWAAGLWLCWLSRGDAHCDWCGYCWHGRWSCHRSYIGWILSFASS